jgi:hypothetical protein
MPGILTACAGGFKPDPPIVTMFVIIQPITNRDGLAQSFY